MAFGAALLLLLIGSPVSGQDLKVEGWVLDAPFGPGLPFTNIYLQGSPHGTVSNEHGRFIFNFTPEQRKDTLCFSHIGYTTVKINVESLLTNRTDSIYLQPTGLSAAEFELLAKQTTVKDVMTNVVDRRKTNHKVSYNASGHYCELLKIDTTYVRMLDAAVLFHSNANLKGTPAYQIKEVRKSKIFQKKKTPYLTFNGLHGLLDVSSPGWTVPAKFKPDQHDIQIDSVVVYDGRRVFVISSVVKGYERKPETIVQWFVDAESYAILQCSGAVTYPSNKRSKSGESLYARITSQQRTILYEEIEGRMYPKSMKMVVSVHYYKDETGPKIYAAELSSTLVMNELTVEDVKPLEGKQLNFYDNLFEIKIPFNKAFWENYNSLPESEEWKKALKHLEILENKTE